MGSADESRACYGWAIVQGPASNAFIFKLLCLSTLNKGKFLCAAASGSFVYERINVTMLHCGEDKTLNCYKREDHAMQVDDTLPTLEQPVPYAFPAGVPTLAETIRLSFRLLRENRRLQALVAVLVLLQTINTSAWENVTPTLNERLALPVASEYFPFTALDLVSWLLLFLLSAFFYAMLLLALAASFQSLPCRLGELLPAALRRTPAACIVLVLGMVATLLGLLLCIVPGVVIMAFLSLALSRAVIGGAGAIASLKWSWTQPPLVRYLLLRTVVLSVVLYMAASAPLSIAMMFGTFDAADAPLSLPSTTLAVATESPITEAETLEIPLYVGIPFGLVGSAISFYVYFIECLIYLQLQRKAP